MLVRTLRKFCLNLQTLNLTTLIIRLTLLKPANSLRWRRAAEHDNASATHAVGVVLGIYAENAARAGRTLDVSALMTSSHLWWERAALLGSQAAVRCVREGPHPDTPPQWLMCTCPALVDQDGSNNTDHTQPCTCPTSGDLPMVRMPLPALPSHARESLQREEAVRRARPMLGATVVAPSTPPMDAARAARCCNPGCESLGTLRCGQCKVARFCSRRCQGVHWPLHNLHCRSPNQEQGRS
jgi:hypothetical protein